LYLQALAKSISEEGIEHSSLSSSYRVQNLISHP